MNDFDTMPMQVRPDVSEFVSAVRARFADLSAEDRDELLGGLEADISELVAERGAQELGDPVAYADEMRSAAGLPPFRARLGQGTDLSARGASEFVGALLDRGAQQAKRLMSLLPWGMGEAVVAMRPAWWVLRAYVAVMWVDRTFITSYDGFDVIFLPTPFAWFGAIVTVVAMVVSVQIGRGKLWLGVTGTLSRVVLLGLNILAVLVLPFVFQQFTYDTQEQYRYYNSYESDEPQSAIVEGREFCNLQAFDAAGQPLPSVQLFRQDGTPLNVRCTNRWDGATGRRVKSGPWLMGDVKRWNVFPQAETIGKGEPAFPVSMLASVPPVTEPTGLAPLVEPTPTVEPEPIPEVTPTPDPEAAEGAEGAEPKKGKKGEKREDRTPNTPVPSVTPSP